MTEYKQTKISLGRFEIIPVFMHLQEKYGFASADRFNLGEYGKIEIHSAGENRINLVCNCDKKIIKDLQELIEQNE